MRKQQQKAKGDLSIEDRKIWKQVAETITPLRPELSFEAQLEALQQSGPNPSGGNPTRSVSPLALNGNAHKPSITGSTPQKKISPPRQIQQIDVKTARKIAKGKTAIDRRLDLHGMTQAQAHFALENFLHSARHAGARTVLIITGKGNLGQGVLRLNVPRWLREPPLNGWVASFSSSASRHGGEGALYVRLRKAPAKKER